MRPVRVFQNAREDNRAGTGEFDPQGNKLSRDLIQPENTGLVNPDAAAFGEIGGQTYLFVGGHADNVEIFRVDADLSGDGTFDLTLVGQTPDIVHDISSMAFLVDGDGGKLVVGGEQSRLEFFDVQVAANGVVTLDQVGEINDAHDPGAEVRDSEDIDVEGGILISASDNDSGIAVVDTGLGIVDEGGIFTGEGATGNDTLNGGEGDDILYGDNAEGADGSSPGGVPAQSGEGRDDVLAGGAGADQMWGEGGDDTFVIGSASDADGDIVVGGNGPDQNTDNDVLDLTGAGAVTIVEDVDVTDAGATTGTVTFEDGSVLTFSQIEEIITDPLNAAPDAIDDAAILDPGTDLLLDLLGNDSDPDSDPLTIIAASDGIVVGGGDTTLTTDGGRPVVVTVAPSGAVTALLVSVADDYLPLGEGDTDAVSFTYTISDGNGLTDTATVSIDIEGENDDPVITTPFMINAPDDSDIGASVAVIQASDVDLGDVLTFSITPDATDDSAGFTIDPVTGEITVAPGFTLPDADADFLWEFEVVVTDSFGATDTLDVELSFGPGTPPPADPECGGLGDPSSSPVTPGVSFGGTDDSETIQGTDIGDTISGNGGDDTIFGNGGDDTLLGNAGNDVLCGGLGNDQIHGGRDDDVLIGGAGDDRVGGNRGDDQIQGGQGQDELEGEEGADLFVIDTLHILSGPLNDDTIIDFEAGIDTITFENLGTTAVSFATVGTDTTVLLDGQLALTVQNATEAEVAAGIVDESTVSIFSF